MEMEEITLRFLLTHVILPPQSPKKPEDDIPALEYDLLLFVYDAFRSFVDQNTTERQASLHSTLLMLKNWIDCQNGNEPNDIDPHNLDKALRDLKPRGQ